MTTAYGLKKPGSTDIELDSIFDSPEKSWEYLLGRWHNSMPISRGEIIERAEQAGYKVVPVAITEIL